MGFRVPESQAGVTETGILRNTSPISANPGFRAPKPTMPRKTLDNPHTQNCEMARLKGESLNSYFEVLEEWERYLAGP